MASDWKTTTFEESSIEILDGDRGKNYPKKSEFTESGYCLFLNTGNVTKDGFKFSSTEFVSSERDQLLRKGKLQREDVVLTTRGTVGNVAYYDSSIPFDHIRINSGMVILRSDDTKILPRYLYLFLRSKLFEDQVIALQSGSAQPQLPIRDIKRVEIKVPSVTEQKTIAHILGSLDDKIELNRQMNETLEAMAQALFKSWFVDFDPVIDNALAAGNAIPDEFIERAEQRKAIEKKDNSDIQHLFPNEFEFTEEMGWIPKGWVVIPIYEIADFINGSSFKSKFFSDENEGLPIIKIAEIKNGISQQTKFTTQEMADKYFISDGSIVFSWSGNPDTSIDTFIWTGGDGWLNQHIFNVVLHEDKDKTFIYYLLKSLKPVFTEIARDKQTTGLGHVTVKDMKRTYTIKPSSSTLEAFARQSNPIFEKWYQNLFSSRELIKLRDTLLPKLMSGELRIPDAAELVDEVL